jgi:hypothetical protein
MNKLNIIILIFTICYSCKTVNTEEEIKEFAINWVENLDGDFSFTKNWEYPDGIYMNEFGQLSCDGLCPPEAERMKDKDGEIIQDSLSAFYQLVDTTHIDFSLKSESNTYEWAWPNLIQFQRINEDTIIGQTLTTISTHSSLNIRIINDMATAWIDYISISDTIKYKFPLKEGEIKIDKSLFDNGIIKADFDMTFVNTIDRDREIYWAGLIYCSID